MPKIDPLAPSVAAAATVELPSAPASNRPDALVNEPQGEASRPLVAPTLDIGTSTPVAVRYFGDASHTASVPSLEDLTLTSDTLIQLNKSTKELAALPSSDQWNDAEIEKRMDLIFKGLSVFPDDIHPLKEDSAFARTVPEPEEKDFWKASFDNLHAIITAAPHWTGIQLYARDLAKAYGRRTNHSHLQPTLEAIDQLTKNAERYEPGVTIQADRLQDADYRYFLAKQLLHWSRGNPQLEHAIVTDLHDLAIKPVYQHRVMRLLQDLGFVSGGDYPFPANDALVVRDHSAVVKFKRPFPLLTSSVIFPPDRWTLTMAAGLEMTITQGNVGTVYMHDIEAGESLLPYFAASLRPDQMAHMDFAEVGSGSGLLALYLALQADFRSIDAVDINPDAPLIGELNKLRLMFELGRDLTHVRFKVTPHLLTGLEDGKKYNLIYACIPQVPSSLGKILNRHLADIYPSKGYPEDIDGLGLIAELLEQAKDRLKENGRLAAVISGRPGLWAVQRLANLRGYMPITLISTRFLQHQTTDLSGYVEIEKSGKRGPFEFWAEGKTISAEEAKKRLDELNAQPKSKQEEMLKDPTFQISHRQYVVLFTPLSHMADEFRQKGLAAQKQYLMEKLHLGYTKDTGSEYEPFRKEMAQHLTSLVGLRLPEEALFVGTTLERMLMNITEVTAAADQPVYSDPHLSLSGKFQNLLERRTVTNNPQVARTRLLSLAQAPDHFLQDIHRASQSGQFTVLVVRPEDGNRLNDVMVRLMENSTWRRHIIIAWQNTDLPVANPPLTTLLVFNRTVQEAMAQLGEDNYSRIPILQAVYETALLEFRRTAGFEIDETAFPQSLGMTHGIRSEDVSPRMRELARYKSHSPSMPATQAVPVIRMDFGESEFPMPIDAMNRAKMALRKPVTEEEILHVLHAYLKSSERGLFEVPKGEIVLGKGVHPLVYSTLVTMGGENSFRVMIPMGSYGQFHSTIHAAGGQEEIFEVDPGSSDTTTFRAQLEKSFSDNSTPVKALLFPYPTNPAGLYFSEALLEEVARFCVDHQIFILADEIFYETGDPEVRTTVFELLSRVPGLDRFLIGFTGNSKDLAKGGTRFGFAYSKNADLLKRVKAVDLDEVDPFALQLANDDYQSSDRAFILHSHRQWLKEKRGQMTAFLKPYAEQGLLSFREPQGGYFVEVDMSAFYGQSFQVKEKIYKVGEKGEGLREAIYDSVGVKCAPAGWSGNPKTMRLVYSLKNLDEGLSKLKTFFDEAGRYVKPEKKTETFKNIPADERARRLLDPTPLRQAVHTADGFLRLQGPTLKEDLKDNGSEYIFNFPIKGRDGRPSGKLGIRYKADPSQPSRLLVDQIYITVTSNQQHYGFELLTSLFDYIHSTDGATRIRLQAEEDGIYAWRHLRGFNLDHKSLTNLENTLAYWKTKLNVPVDDQAVKKARSPGDFTNDIVASEPQPVLLPIARRVFANLRLTEPQLLEKTRHVGELALLVQTGAENIAIADVARTYTAFLDLTDAEAYGRFVDSVITYWEERQDRVPRAAKIIERWKEKKTKLETTPRQDNDIPSAEGDQITTPQAEPVEITADPTKPRGPQAFQGTSFLGRSTGNTAADARPLPRDLHPSSAAALRTYLQRIGCGTLARAWQQGRVRFTKLELHQLDRARRTGQHQLARQLTTKLRAPLSLAMTGTNLLGNSRTGLSNGARVSMMR